MSFYDSVYCDSLTIRIPLYMESSSSREHDEALTIELNKHDFHSSESDSVRFKLTFDYPEFTRVTQGYYYKLSLVMLQKDLIHLKEQGYGTAFLYDADYLVTLSFTFYEKELYVSGEICHSYETGILKTDTPRMRPLNPDKEMNELPESSFAGLRTIFGAARLRRSSINDLILKLDDITSKLKNRDPLWEQDFSCRVDSQPVLKENENQSVIFDHDNYGYQGTIASKKSYWLRYFFWIGVGLFIFLQFFHVSENANESYTRGLTAIFLVAGLIIRDMRYRIASVLLMILTYLI